ncbi:bifunctional diaminohydroxyphosphoribosylaminopyrimidine deaminase/5-amino-6-(5-phosphoribosylamino)uracil reductase RibD [Abyssalbus ytuae]|uniref:Riboflavin biosynthesis protein RibD n=1 Tax=Abyssalbus ytuae TaxID=2926907 RepID=A0A9E6ZNM9_9FLAO|nr:bifunctional diaminohydroxyphosphoribosylaminopyrimidine deaminase/5-amino-6-(5-phosphoribosylamino)uracil reductase RibD [Abyssalbus ytuae]UOB17690.1 bifunctional diaminohydroxyphosphoribosylaminopyrimidine deaminase/5-amino-6-(5-phosphoribosylamino)uracil reductase RibD [Abyssalbus ytuae]
MNLHEKYILRCIQLAKNALGTSFPNPRVGCVIVHNGKIIAEGYTSAYGDNHAEVNAINAVKDKSVLQNSTLYVTLEPCSHYGKTPPCSDLIVKHKIPNVVIGTLDINDKVSGRGVKKLKESGCNVIVGILEYECKEHHKHFLIYQREKRPYVILKWAQSKDGYISPSDKKEKKPVWITNQYSRLMTHKWRSEEQAILVGTTTVFDDNPKLNTRDWHGKSPVRIIIDRKLKIPKDSAVFNNSAKTIVICDHNENKNIRNHIAIERIDFTKNIAHQICKVIFKHELMSVIIEGGTKTLQTFIDENLWDEARVFKGNTVLNNGTKAPVISGKVFNTFSILSDTLTIYYKND